MELAFLEFADELVAVAEVLLAEGRELLGFVVASLDRFEVEALLTRDVHILSVHGEGKSMLLSGLIEVANHKLIPIILDMHRLRLLEAQIKCLLVFQPNQLGNRIVLEGIFVAAPVQMQDLIKQRPLLIGQLIYLQCLVINKHSYPIRPLTVLSERNLDDGLASLIDDLIFRHTLKKH